MHLCVYLLTLVLSVSGLQAVTAQSRYGQFTSCADVLQNSRNNGQPVPKDGDYVISLPGLCAITVYCAGFSTGSPKEYITLTSGRSKNFAVVYDIVGSVDGCQQQHPVEFYSQEGRTEFYRIRINVPQLTVVLDDFTFSVGFGTQNISYGFAGDMYAFEPTCKPLGQMSIDLKGTPFLISPDTKWVWSGNYVDGNTDGQVYMENTDYIGCFTDNGDRLLPANKITDDHLMTPEKCIEHCINGSFPYAGTEYSRECFCGDSYSKYPRLHDSECQASCTGDSSRHCGGTWKISVYSTESRQTMSARCGGYPGHCNPVLASQPNQPALKLVIAPSHPCLHGACGNNEVCLAVSLGSFQCLSSTTCSGAACSSAQVVSNNAECPVGLLPLQCGCQGGCTGARFTTPGGQCTTQNGKSQVTCIAGDPGHLSFTDVQSGSTVFCPNGTQIVGCSYWDSTQGHTGNGLGSMEKTNNKCSTPTCSRCTVYARCMEYVCGCQNGGTCNFITGQCQCPPGYYGNQCEDFDYCAYYEDHNDNGQPACSAGTCQAVPSVDIRTFGTDQSSTAGTCVFPFAFQRQTYTQCVDTNEVGPPFACGTYFDGVDDHIELGEWNLGPVYTIAIWVNPATNDNRRRTIVGGVTGCRDFGLYMQNGRFMAYYSPVGGGCTAGLQGSQYNLNNWYLVSMTNNGTHITLYTDGVQQAQTAIRPYYLGTSQGFWIGGSKCCAGEIFKGHMKSVKMWKREVDASEVTVSMSAQESINSTMEALNEGLVAHYELGQLINVSCQGVDHGGEDWTLHQDQDVSGVHCNVNRFTIPQGITVQVAPFDGTQGGTFEVYAEEIHISGYLNAAGVGYRGGQSPDRPQQDGAPGESYHTTSSSSDTNLNQQTYQPHRGGGGGGWGGATSHGSLTTGRPGGGGGYGTAGGAAQRNNWNGRGQGGAVYGSPDLHQMYMGSGGGSGGNAADLTTNPKGGYGGNGGGAVGLYARGLVQIQGHVSVAGQNGQGDISSSPGCAGCPAACQAPSASSCYGNSSSACWDNSGPGGGGSGGSLYIIGNIVDVGWDQLWHQGGAGGLGGGGEGCGGDGGYGRIRVDAVTFSGRLPSTSAQLNIFNSTTHYQDLSISGQKLIQYNSDLQYGNEIYWGCFEDRVQDRHFAFTLPVSDDTKRQMSPQYCMSQCRQRGYAFSGVEYGFECYCDNAFHLNLRRSDDDCNQACTGDNQQYCGAAYRMSVYGPKPFVPVDGVNGAEQQCRPWCVTGGAYSNVPQWGYCDLSSVMTNSYQIQCQCPDGFQGSSCDQVCPQGSWGPNCATVCICNSTNTDSCNPRDGTCSCKAGYQGGTCDLQCPTGYFGDRCSGRCNCPSTATCDFVTGACVCAAGWRGERCQFRCPPGRYGPGCTQSCQCFQGACSPEDGTCTCDDGYKLPFCAEQCDPGNYGPSCLSECDCHGHPCDPFTGICNCGPGYQGSRCEKLCPHGKYGQGCNSVCQCQNGAGCDHISGDCNCAPGFTGMVCDQPCDNWRYGADCGVGCTCNQQNTQKCDAKVGTCLCYPGFTGSQCSQLCPGGYYGQNCASRCNCLNNAPCDKVTGRCQCPPGFTGDTCQNACPDGHYGHNCAETCTAPCSPGFCNRVEGFCICQAGPNCTFCPSGYYGSQCSLVCQCMHGVCDGQGNCTCDPGWQGSQCDTPCPDGTYGDGCLKRCQCQHGQCSRVDGSCSCGPGYQGPLCDQPCPNGTFGVACAGQCQPCGPGAQTQSCDPVTGECLCLPGYFGLLCDRPCPENTYGTNCSQSCSCINGDCSNVDGTCECMPGYTGTMCDQQCTPGTWGPDCRNQCTCPGHASSCDTSSGDCLCAPGFTGETCDESCPLGYFGQNCQSKCACDMSVAECSPIDGSCACLPGFQGATCDLCPVGFYGLNCSLRCDCSGNGACDFTGTCDCDPGFVGDRCQTPCEQDVKWGKDCARDCDCSGQHCDFKEGICRCDPGKTGRTCDQACDPVHYGFECGQVCECKNNATCDPVTGVCTCTPGWDGQHCDQLCPVGKYGPGCGLNCLCPSGIRCHPTTGKCICQPGYSGPTCSITCPDGYWGRGCASPCPASCTTGCFPDTGQCKCTSTSCSAGFVCMQSGVCLSSAIAGLISSTTTTQASATWTPVPHTPSPGNQNSGTGNSGSSSGSHPGTNRPPTNNKTPTSAQQTSSGGGGSSGLSGGQIAGIIIGLLLGAVLVAGIVLVIMRRRSAYDLDGLFSIFRRGSRAGLYTTGDDCIYGAENPVYFTKKTEEEPAPPAEEPSAGTITLQHDLEETSES